MEEADQRKKGKGKRKISVFVVCSSRIQYELGRQKRRKRRLESTEKEEKKERRNTNEKKKWVITEERGHK